MALNIPKILETNIFPRTRATKEGVGTNPKDKIEKENEDEFIWEIIDP